MLVHAYATSSGKARWSGPHHAIKMLHFVLFNNVTCYTKSIVSRIHVNTINFCNITCTLVAIGVILRSLECTTNGIEYHMTLNYYVSCRTQNIFYEQNKQHIPPENISDMDQGHGATCYPTWQVLGGKTTTKEPPLGIWDEKSDSIF
jgi:hypothetical protein